MPVPSPRNKILPARGNIADLQAGLAELAEGEICYAFDQDQYYQKEGGILVAVGATKAQGLLADSSLQPGDNISELYNDLGYVQAGDIIDAPVQSVNGKTGDVVLDSDDVGAPSDAEFATLEGRVLANEVAHGNNLQKDVEQDGRLDAVEAKDTEQDGRLDTINFKDAEQDGRLDAIDFKDAEQDGRLDSVESDIAIIDLTLDSKADLVNGLIPTSQIPAIAITEFLGDVSSEAEMLALTGQPGDWCFRSDEGFGYVIVAEPPSSIDNWQQIATPGGDVNSVNGQTGTVVLSAADVGAIPATELPNLAPSTIDLQAVTDNGSTTTSGATFGGDVTIGAYPSDGSAKVFTGAGQYCARKDDGTGGLILYKDGTNNADKTVQILTNGSASFAGGDIVLYDNGSATFADENISLNANGRAQFAGDKIIFEADGSGSFVSRVNIGASDHSDRAVSAYNNARTVGAVSAANYDPSGILFQGYSASVDDSNASIEIKSDGSIRAGGDPTDPHFILNGADGSASFSSTVQTTGAFVSTGQNPQNYVFQGIKDSTKTSWIFNDGSATFAQSLTVASYDTPIGAFIRSGGTGISQGCLYLVNNKPESPNNLLIFGRSDGDGTDNKFQIANDGSASFAGDVQVGEATGGDRGIRLYKDGGINVYNSADPAVAEAVWQVVDVNNDVTSRIISDGSASFAGTVESGGGYDDATGGVSFFPTGGVISSRPSGSADYVWQGFQNGVGVTSEITADGSVSFAGNEFTINKFGSINKCWTISSLNNGTYSDQDTSLWNGYATDGTLTTAIRADGSASFANGGYTIAAGGQVTNSQGFQAGGNAAAGEAGSSLGETGKILATSASNAAGLEIRQTGGTAVTASIKGSGSASFAGGDITLNADGSAELAGNVSVNGLYSAGLITCNRTSALGGVWSGTLNGVATSTIYASGTASFVGAKFAIDVDGGAKLGANTDGTDPKIQLHASGNAEFSNSIVSGNATASTDYLRYSPGVNNLQIRNTSDQPTVLLYQDSEAAPTVLIGKDGSAEFKGTVEIGDDSRYINAYSNGQLWIKYDSSNVTASTSAFRLADETSTTYLVRGDGGVRLGGADASSSPSIALNANGSATFAGQINGTTVGTSDERFKENIAPANPQLDDVVVLGGLLKNFDWNEDAPVNEEIRATRQLGLIAQEAEEVCPSLVKTISRTKQGEELTPAELDEEGNEITPATYEELDDSYKGISHDALVMKLLGAIAEQQTQIADLQARLDAVEGA